MKQKIISKHEETRDLSKYKKFFEKEELTPNSENKIILKSLILSALKGIQAINTKKVLVDLLNIY